MTATLLSANIFGSYFQDRFSTVHYLIVVGANGTGKSAFGETYECLGYRAVNITNATEAFYYRMFGTIEYGQVTLIVEEFDKMDENSQIMAMLKVGYHPFGKVPRMNNDNTKMEFFFPFGFKILIAEKSPDEDKARGILDRSFKNKSYKGTPDFNIKEIRNPQGNIERQNKFDEMNHLRKILLAYRMLHIKDPYKEIKIGLDGRDEELCKPLLQLFYTLGASEPTLGELEATLQYFLDIKNNRKSDSLEGTLYPIVKNAVSNFGKDYVSLLQDDFTNRLRSISTTELWQEITSSLEGDFDRYMDKDGIEHPIYEYELEIQEAIEGNQHVWIKKARGIGATEFLIRYLCWKALSTNELDYKSVFIIAGTREEFANEIKERMERLFQNEYAGVIHDSKHTECYINNTKFKVFPTKRLKDVRGYIDVAYLFIDEADFFDKKEQEELKYVIKSYEEKSKGKIILVSTAGQSGGLFETIENDPNSDFKKVFMLVNKGRGKIFDDKFLDEQKEKDPAFYSREYEGPYGFGLGNVFLYEDIEKCCSLWKQTKINHAAPISMGIDPGFGSSKFAITVLMLEDNILRVLLAEEYDKASYE